MKAVYNLSVKDSGSESIKTWRRDIWACVAALHCHISPWQEDMVSLVGWDSTGEDLNAAYVVPLLRNSWRKYLNT